MSLFYEDFELGAVFSSRTRTITEADIVSFAGLSGDFVELHISEEFARTGPFGRRIAHGALIFSISTGLMTQMCDISATVVAFYGVDRLRFIKPVYIGDTIHVTKKVVGKREKGEHGIVSFETNVLNQQEQPVIIYTDQLMLKRRT